MGFTHGFGEAVGRWVGWSLAAEARLLVHLPHQNRLFFKQELVIKEPSMFSLLLSNWFCSCWFAAAHRGEFQQIPLGCITACPRHCSSSPSPTAGLAAAVLQFVTCSDWAGRCCLQSSVRLVCLTVPLHTVQTMLPGGAQHT